MELGIPASLIPIAKSNNIDYNFYKVAEECGEVTQALMQCYVAKTKSSNQLIEHLVEELSDLLIRIQMLSHAESLVDRIAEQIERKSREIVKQSQRHRNG